MRRRLGLLFVAWLWGLATTVERLQLRFSLVADRLERGETLNRPQVELLVVTGSDWGRYLVHVLAVGLLAALLVWFAGGWWYRKRLQLSGADPSAAEARRVYLLTGLVWVLPVLAAALAGPWQGPTPWEAHGPLLSRIGAIGHLLSFGVSAAVVLRVFPVRRGPALLWFLLLPAALVILLALAGAAPPR